MELYILPLSTRPRTISKGTDMRSESRGGGQGISERH